MGEQSVITDGDAQTGERVEDGQDEQVLPVQGSAPRQPSTQGERDRRPKEDNRPHDALGRLVLDRNHLRDGHRSLRP